MTDSHNCESCSMPIESGPYCQHCAPQGELIAFDECLERFMQWTRKRNPQGTEAELKTQTLQFMATMPAWKDNPRLKTAG